MRDAFSVALEALRESLELADETIRSLKLGVPGRVELSCGWALVYDSPDGLRRKLHVERDGKAVDIESFQLSIADRREAARAIPALVDQMVTRRSDRAVDIKATADDLDTYLDELADQ